MLSAGKYHGDESRVLIWPRPFSDRRVAEMLAELHSGMVGQAMGA